MAEDFGYFYNKHYIKVDDKNRITDFFSDGPCANRSTEGYILFNDKGGYQFRLMPNMQENAPIMNFDSGAYLYSYIDGQVHKRTELEIQNDIDEAREAQIDTYKSAKISKSKSMLSDYLISHPLLYTDEKYYSVTSEKQALLTSSLVAYEAEVKLAESGYSITPILTWNSTGEECVEWNLQDLTMLSLTIKAYVKRFVSYQQSLEVQIRNCATVADVEAVVINYDDAPV